jgi:hypothetical protein
VTAPQLKTTYPNGREARAFDIVEGFVNYAEHPRNPFIAQIVRVIPKAGAAEIAFIRRPASMARRMPYFLLQNLAARAVERDIRPLDDLSLRHRASRPVAKYLKAALGE